MVDPNAPEGQPLHVPVPVTPARQPAPPTLQPVPAAPQPVQPAQQSVFVVEPESATTTLPQPDTPQPSASQPDTPPTDTPPTDTPQPGAKKRKPKRSRGRHFIEWTIVLGVALALALLIRAFVFGAFYIPTNSMDPALESGDRVLVNKLSYFRAGPSVGDLVVFLPPAASATSGTDDIADIELIKRVVAVGGQTVQGIGGGLFINGSPIVEEYLDPSVWTRPFLRVLVPDDHVFVMGDNRSNSRDSRQFGPVPTDNVIGRAFLIYWPPGSIGRP